MSYQEWTRLYFSAFYYAYGKSDDNTQLATDFANWYVKDTSGERQISKAFVAWKEIQYENEAEQKLDAYVKGDPNA